MNNITVLRGRNWTLARINEAINDFSNTHQRIRPITENAMESLLRQGLNRNFNFTASYLGPTLFYRPADIFPLAVGANRNVFDITADNIKNIINRILREYPDAVLAVSERGLFIGERNHVEDLIQRLDRRRRVDVIRRREVREVRHYKPFMTHFIRAERRRQRFHKAAFYIGYKDEDDDIFMAYSPELFEINGALEDVSPNPPDADRGRVIYNRLDPAFPITYQPTQADTISLVIQRQQILSAYQLMTTASQALTPGSGTRANSYQVVIRFVRPDGEYEYKTLPLATIRRSQAAFEEWVEDLRYIPEYNPRFRAYVNAPSSLFDAEVDTGFFVLRYMKMNNNNNNNRLPPLEQTGRGLYEAFGKEQSKYLLYKAQLLTEDNTNNNCIQQALILCGCNDRTMSKCTRADELVEFIKKNSLPISVIYNIPDIKDNDDRMTKENRIFLKITEKSNGKYYYRVRKEDVEINYMYKSPNTQHYICYDVKRKHVEKLEGEPEFLDNIYMDEYVIVKKEGDEIYIVRNWASVPKMENVKAPEEKTHYIMYDYETVVDLGADSISIPYGMSYALFDNKSLERLEELEARAVKKDSTVEREIDEFIKSKCHNIVGWDCSDIFINRLTNVISTSEEGSRYILMGFNNTVFDNFLFVNALLNARSQFESDPIQHVEYQGTNKISNMCFLHNKCTSWDLKRHLTTGTLMELCNDFKVERFAKRPDLISHKQVQKIFNTHGRENFFSHLHEAVSAESLETYNNYDVLSLALLFHNYKKFIYSFPIIKKAYEVDQRLKYIYDHVSLPSFLYKVSTVFSEINGINLPKLNFDQYKFVREGTVAGRVEVHGKPQAKYEEEVYSFDVASMYPSAMFVLPVTYPAGSLIDRAMTMEDIDRLFNSNFDKHGYYTADIDQTVLVDSRKPIIRCYKEDNGNNWNYDWEVVYQHDIVLSNVDIKQLLKYGCKVELKEGKRMIEFTEKVENFDLFGWLSDFMKTKNQQDIYKEEKSDLYNPNIRMLCKLIMNSLSGKYMQKANEKVCVQMSLEDFNGNIEINEDMIPDSLNVIGYLNSKTIVVEYKKKPEKITAIKPVYIGSYIYSHCRADFYDRMLFPLGQDACLYHDTDSVKFLKKDFYLIKEKLETSLVPHNQKILAVEPRYAWHPQYKKGSKVFGSFENELKEGNNLTYINDKKEWACFKISPTGEILWSDFSFKGVRPSSCLIDLNLRMPSEFISEIKKGQKSITNQELAFEFDLARGEEFRFNNPSNLLKTFEQLFKGQPIYIMNSQFIREVKNTQVRVIYVLKKISPGKTK